MNEEITQQVRDNIRKNVKILRTPKTIKAFAQETGIAAKNISAIEEGRAVSITNLVIISNKTGVSLDDICKTLLK